MKHAFIGSILGALLAICVPFRAAAQEDPSLPPLQLYVLVEAGHMVANQASVSNILDVLYAAPFCSNLTNNPTNKQFWKAVGLHSFSALAIADFFGQIEELYDVPEGVLSPDDAQGWWEGAERRAYAILLEKGEDFANQYTVDVCLYLINNYTTYGKIPVPDGPNLPLINPQ